ncbi:Ig-like domain-containing protein [Nocardioides sp. AX2bis]|uniref:Ig-like domain-containing protein n=1 Tax=Nocardioides sp. AX2bis TaxID=2653157 RepID=UPI00135B5A5F|nr:Ig-like domain-containing protein [Nocardioides sp. AX2bis]
MVCLTMVLGLLLLGGPPAVAAPAVPSGLSPNGGTVSDSPVFRWTPVAGATSYDIEISVSETFDTTVYKATTTNFQATPTVALKTGEAWWRVRSSDSTGVSDWSVASFTNSSKAGPAPVTPLPGTILSQPADPPLLTWQPLPQATGYQVEIDGGENDWIGTTTYDTQTTSLVVPDPQENGNYWWRVRAVLGPGVNTLWSEERDYKIGPLPVVRDTSVSPVNDPDTTVDDVVFDWAPVAGAISYDLQVDDDDSFSAPIDTVVVKGTSYSNPVTYDNDQYWWRVRARNIFGKAEEWVLGGQPAGQDGVQVRQFRRAWPDAPTQVYPEDSAVVGDDFYYQWSPVPHASRYRLEVGRDPNFSPTTYESCFTTETTYNAGFYGDDCMVVPGRTYFWRVQALDGPRRPEVNGIYSSIHQFRYDPGTVTQTSPVDGETVDIPTLRWSPARDAIEYDVKLTWSGGSRSITTASTSWTFSGRNPLDPAKGPFEWTVAAVDRNGVASQVPIVGEKFFLSGEVTTTEAVPLTPLSPGIDDSSSTRFPTLSWEPLPTAAYYQVHVGTAGSGSFTQLPDSFAYPAASDTAKTYLNAGVYDWFVVALDSRGAVLGRGSISAFTVGALDAVSGQRIALDGSGLDGQGSPCKVAFSGPSDTTSRCEGMRGTPVLDWEPVPDAGYYMIYVSRDREFTNMVYGSKGTPSQIPTTQNTRWNPLAALPDSQAGQAYFWFIRPCKALGVCAADPTLATHGFDKQSNKVEQLLPADNSTQANDITFTWRDYLLTNQDPAFQDGTTTEQSSQAARGYRLQVGTSPAFTTVIDDVTVDQRTYTAFNKTYPEGDLYWRIQPVDGAGNSLTWSDARKFTKKSPAVSLDGPADGSAAASTQPFSWKPLEFAASYDLEVYSNADVTGSSLNRVFSVNSKQVAYTSPKALPVSSQPYAWHVRRVDVDGRKGAWSEWRYFTVTGGLPQLLSPGPGASVNGREGMFTWTAVNGATSYKFERRAVGASSVTETLPLTSNLMWAPLKTITDGSWEWRVTALDVNRQTMGSTEWRTFTTTTVQPDTIRPTVIDKTPVRSAARAANFVATFSEPVAGVRTATMQLYRKGTSTPVAGKVTLSTSKWVASLNPKRNLRVGQVYVLKLRSGITDLAGNELAATSWKATAR